MITEVTLAVCFVIRSYLQFYKTYDNGFMELIFIVVYFLLNIYCINIYIQEKGRAMKILLSGQQNSAANSVSIA